MGASNLNLRRKIPTSKLMTFVSTEFNLISSIKPRGIQNQTENFNQLNKLNKNPRLYEKGKRSYPATTCMYVLIKSRIPHVEFERVNYE